MATQVRDVVAFRDDLLFDGAVNVDWFLDDPEKAVVAAQAFVFHGPQYHGVTQADVGTTHGHRLEDTATFARSVVRRCCGLEDEPFALAIAGYGTGKSHLALALAVLLSDPTGAAADTVLRAIEAADATLGAETGAMLAEQKRPVLVVALNGMRSFDLTAEVTRQVMHQVRAGELDTRRLEELRPRFIQAANMVRMSSESIVGELVDECDAPDVEALLDALNDQDEVIYARVQEFYAARGMAIRALGGESVRDVIEAAATEYCGEGKPFARLLVLFDEFGRYTEFATLRSQVAGSGALQDLFEGIQAHADVACFVGFIQFELNAYVQRVAPEFRNEILRYVTRYQTARKAYLSINLETLLASLLEKRKPEQLDSWFDTEQALQKSEDVMGAINKWFPQSPNHLLWTTPEQFHGVIRKGCWPLSPYSTWFLFSLAAAGKHLQERSALAFLGDALARCEDRAVVDEGSPMLAPVDLWSDALQQELITSEEGGQQGSVAHAYTSVEARHGAQLPEDARSLLRAVVMASKVGLRAEDQDDAIEALAAISGLTVDAVRGQTRQLQDEYNVVEWDERFQSFDILGDAVPRSQFLAFVRQRVASSFDEQGKAKLFASKASEWCDLLDDLDCDFAERNSITTTEWRYEAVTSNIEFLGTHLKYAIDRWCKAVGVDEPRGTVIYCYADQGRDSETVVAEAGKRLRALAREAGGGPPPILVVFLCDEEGQLGRALAELAVLEDSLSEEDSARFGSLVGAHREKMLDVIRGQVESMVKERRYVTALREDLEERRLTRVGTELFSLIYKRPLPFPFDGFTTARGNAADTCQQLTTELLRGSLDFDAVIAKPAKAKNRAVNVLNDSWGAFTKTGAISRRPSHPVVRSTTQKWDQILQSDQERFLVGPALRELCMRPHGANIASAGLLFGLFVAPRAEGLMIVRDGQQYAVAQWLQDEVFRGKVLDIGALDEVELVSLGEASSEWEALLDEWEQEESHRGRIACLQRAVDLKGRVPVPPALGYRLIHLEEQAGAALTSVGEMEKRVDDAVRRLERGYDQGNVSDLSWGASQLVSLREKMASEDPLWTHHQYDELYPHIERARQRIIQIFDPWLGRQFPASGHPDAVGEFKHKMLILVGGNLKRLQLDDPYEQLETKVAELVRNAEILAEARQLLRDVRSWLEQHADARRIVRVAEVRGLRGVGKEFSSRLQGMSRRIEMPELSAARTQLATFLESLKNAESAVTDQAASLWDSELASEADLEARLAEVESLTAAFEGCDADLQDLFLMRRVLQTYQRGYLQLRDENLTWQEFEGLGARLQEEAESAFGEDEPPWPADETIGRLVSGIGEHRRQASARWVETIDAEASSIEGMSAADANRLRMRAMRAPAALTDAHGKRVTKLLKQIEARLESLEVDGLVERFRALPKPSKRRFLHIAGEILDET